MPLFPLYQISSNMRLPPCLYNNYKKRKRKKEEDISGTSFVIWLGHLPQQDRTAQQLVKFSWFLEDLGGNEPGRGAERRSAGFKYFGKKELRISTDKLPLVWKILEKRTTGCKNHQFGWLWRLWRERINPSTGRRKDSSVGFLGCLVICRRRFKSLVGGSSVSVGKGRGRGVHGVGGCRVVVSTGCCFFGLGICNKIKKNGQNKQNCNNRRTMSSIPATLQLWDSMPAMTGLCHQYWQQQDYVANMGIKRTMSSIVATSGICHQCWQQQKYVTNTSNHTTISSIPATTDYVINTSSNNRTMPSIPAATRLCQYSRKRKTTSTVINTSSNTAMSIPVEREGPCQLSLIPAATRGLCCHIQTVKQSNEFILCAEVKFRFQSISDGCFALQICSHLSL